MQLKDIAFARANDRWDTLDIGLFAIDERAYRLIERQITADRVAAHFAALRIGTVERYPLPNLLAIKFVIRNALDGGASRSLLSDVSGRAFGAMLLRMEIGK
jgi:hypothetical protein